jgi:excisionase family DNA binding protein
MSPSNEKRATLTVAEVAAELRISEAGVREAIRVGQIPHLRFGRRIVIPRLAFEKMLGGS